MRNASGLFAVVAMVALCAGAVQAEPVEILDYHSAIQVPRQGPITVTETIQARFAGRQHGIYRDIPTVYPGPWLTRHTVGLDILSVSRDGRPSPYHTEGQGNGRRLYVGKEGTRLQPGTYTYVIVYEIDRQLGYFENHDELYWNVTGLGWEGPIRKCTAVVTLPRGIGRGDLQLKAYTGRKGDRDEHYRQTFDEEGRPVFTTTGLLPAGYTMTIVVGWPKGFVEEPTDSDRRAFFLRDNLGPLVGVLGLLAVLAYCFGTWLAVGRDPARGVIIPLFEPPDGMSPAAARFLMRMGYDRTCLVANVISLAVKGYLTIEEEDGDYTLVRAEGAPTKMTADEKAVRQALRLHKVDRIELDSKNSKRFIKATAKLKTELVVDVARHHFSTNRAYIVPAVLLSLTSFLAAGLLSPSGERAGFVFMCVWLGGWSIGVTALLTVAVGAWRRALSAGGAGCVAGGVGALGITLFATPFVIGEIVGICMIVAASSFWVLPLLVAAVVINVAYYHLIKAPTRGGRKLMDDLEGFRMYLGAAEQDYLNWRHAPEKTPDVFERFLPYALALGVENEWAEQFAGIVDDAQQSMTWCRGPAFASMGAAAFASSLGSSMGGAISSASVAPGSSSGFGGGGGAGGGGGGGGGGAW